MSGKTTIEWTAMPGFAPAVWNPTTGCTRVSAGCDNCYAFALHDKRYATNLKVTREQSAAKISVETARHLGAALPWPKQYDLPFSRVQVLEERLDVPLRTRKPTCYFLDSMADLFHEDVPDEFIQRVWRAMAGCARHRFLILTKRPERMRAWAERYDPAIFDNIWLGTSVEDQRAADERIPHLLATPAAVRFLSCEPLLGPVELQPALGIYSHRGQPCCVDRDGWHRRGEGMFGTMEYSKPGIDWVISGGESGPRARPMDLAWARSLRDQCAAAGVSFFMKQLGSNPCGSIDQGGAEPVTSFSFRESHGRDMAEWPEDLRIRTWPQ